jgi:hypothetical protein
LIDGTSRRFNIPDSVARSGVREGADIGRGRSRKRTSSKSTYDEAKAVRRS